MERRGREWGSGLAARKKTQKVKRGSTKKTKLEANLLIKSYLENKWLTLNDKDTVFQFSQYEEKTLGTYACPRGSNDDAIMALLWAVYFVISDFYDDRDGSVKVIETKYKISGDKGEEDLPVINDDEYGSGNYVDEDGWRWEKEDGWDLMTSDGDVF